MSNQKSNSRILVDYERNPEQDLAVIYPLAARLLGEDRASCMIEVRGGLQLFKSEVTPAAVSFKRFTANISDPQEMADMQAAMKLAAAIADNMNARWMTAELAKSARTAVADAIKLRDESPDVEVWYCRERPPLGGGVAHSFHCVDCDRLQTADEVKESLPFGGDAFRVLCYADLDLKDEFLNQDALVAEVMGNVAEFHNQNLMTMLEPHRSREVSRGVSRGLATDMPPVPAAPASKSANRGAKR